MIGQCEQFVGVSVVVVGGGVVEVPGLQQEVLPAEWSVLTDACRGRQLHLREVQLARAFD